QFHFYDEVDSNAGKTVSGRLSVKPLPFDLEIGGSGLYGAQDRALDSRDPIWFVGADLLGHFGGLDVKAQWLYGKGKGETDRLNEHVVVKAEYLYNGEYGQVPQIPNNVFTSSLLLMY